MLSNNTKNMNIFNTLKGIITAITLVIMSLTGSTAPAPVTQIAFVASTTDAVVHETIAQATTTTQDDVTTAYELGKAMGQLQEKVVELSQQPMEPSTTSPTSAPIIPTPAPTTSLAPVSQARIEIISTAGNSRIQDKHIAVQGDPISNDNIMDIGAIVVDQYGVVVTQGLIMITTTDPNQNTTTYSRNVNGQILFPFEYDFHFSGDHTITFSVEGLTDSHGDAMHDLTNSVTVTAQ